MPSKIVVTGALGHIGSRLIRDLPAYFPKTELVLLDNMATQRYSSLFNLHRSVSYQFLEEDILKCSLAPIFANAQAVVHLAAITNAAGSFEIREKVERENLLGTQRVAEACSSANVPLVFLSSTSVYGTSKSKVDEKCGPEDLKPQSPYAETKLREEACLKEISRLRYVTFRFGTIFGISPGMRFHTAVNKFCWQAIMGQPITVWKTALHQVRPYLDLGDAVRAIAFVLKEGIFDREIYNVLTINASVSSILEVVRKSLRDAKIELVEAAIMNQLSYEVDPSKFKALGFNYQGDLREGIRETLELLGSLKGKAIGSLKAA